MARLNGHRQTKGTETDKPIPTATAPHLDSTLSSFIRKSDERDKIINKKINELIEEKEKERKLLI
jgi:hypothetical protein